jgi:hypothetical protein
VFLVSIAMATEVSKPGDSARDQSEAELQTENLEISAANEEDSKQSRSCLTLGFSSQLSVQL